MNWAYSLIKSTDVETHISAPIQFHCNFRDRDFHYHLNRFQRVFGLSKSEWQVRHINRFVARFHRAHQQGVIGYANKEHIDVIHFHFATVAVKYPQITNSSQYIKVVSFYGYDYEFALHQDPTLRSKYKDLFNNVDLFITEGRHGKEILISLGCSSEKIEVIHLGIVPGQNNSQAKVKVDGQLKMIQPATFTRKKGFEYTIEAFGQAFKRCPNLKLTLAGEIADRSYYKSCQALIKQLNLERQIKIRPFIETSQWHQTLNEHDVLIQPSTYTDEMDCEGGAPVSLIDAQALGLPIISTEHCDIPEVVQHDVTGVLCEEKNVEQLSRAIEYFYNMDLKTYQGFSERAQRHVREHYNIAKSGKQLTTCYQRLLL